MEITNSMQMLTTEEWSESTLAAFSDFSSLHFGEFERLDCVEVQIYTDSRSDPARGIVKLLQLTFAHGEGLLFDPLWSSGVRVGSMSGVDSWIERHQHLFGPLGVQQWKR